MAYRNGTYIAFHANGTSQPTESDMKYYNLLRAWHVRDDCDLEFVNSHEKTAAVRDSSTKETLRRRLRERLANSKNIVLIIGQTTREDTDWVPFEIATAVDDYGLPIIAAYTDYSVVVSPVDLSPWWPPALAERAWKGSADVLHVAFRQAPLTDSIPRFHLNNRPNGPLDFYTYQSHVHWGLAPRPISDFL